MHPLQGARMLHDWLLPIHLQIDLIHHNFQAYINISTSTSREKTIPNPSILPVYDKQTNVNYIYHPIYFEIPLPHLQLTIQQRQKNVNTLLFCLRNCLKNPVLIGRTNSHALEQTTTVEFGGSL